jgi:hypothetical protein
LTHQQQEQDYQKLIEFKNYQLLHKQKELLEIKGGPVYFSNSTITAVG